MEILNIYINIPTLICMLFMPKHGHCLGKRRKRMLYVLLFKSLFHNGEKHKYTFHRKQFVFRRRGVSFLLSLSSSAPLHSQSSCTISTTQANQDQGQGSFLAPKYQRLILLIWDPILLLRLLLGRAA